MSGNRAAHSCKVILHVNAKLGISIVRKANNVLCAAPKQHQCAGNKRLSNLNASSVQLTAVA
jgi:hypothetical protein